MLAIGVPLSAQAQHFHELDKNFCILKLGPYGMHLTEYQPDTSARQELCGDIPSTGRTVMVLDYIEGELRSLPVEVRVIKDTGSEQDLQAITVVHLPAKVYPGGFINFEYSFDQPGKFIGISHRWRQAGACRAIPDLSRRIGSGFALHALHHGHSPARSDCRWSGDLLFPARSSQILGQHSFVGSRPSGRWSSNAPK